MLEIADDVIIEEQEEKQVDDEKQWCVYMHINNVNRKKYIGITSQDPENRWKNGKGYKSQTVFWNAIQKYGWNNFEHEIIFENLTIHEAKEKEVEFIALYKTNCNRYNHPSYGYNMTDGGDNIYEITLETRKKMSEVAKARLADPNNHPWTGRHHTEETKEKIRKTLTGKMVGENNPNFGNHKLAGENNPFYGKHHTEEAKEKLRKAHLGKKASEETKRKQSEMRKGYQSARANAVYCIELDELFWGQQNAVEKYGFNRCCIGDCCRGKQQSAGKHPITDEPLHWKYVYDQIGANGKKIYGAITLGYINEQRVIQYLENIKKGD